MDLRSLISKLDTIDQRKLLKEAEDVLEAIQGIQYSDVEALAKTLPPPKDVERATALGKLARDNSLPGLFDPFTNKFVNANGQFAKIGAYSSEIDTLKSKGLMPLGAETSNWGMGQDRAAAQAGNLSAQEVIKKAYRADAIMDLALPKLAQPGIGQSSAAPEAAPNAQAPASGQAGAPQNESIGKSSGIAKGLLEEFGYTKASIVEAIDRAQHQELKKLITDLTPYQGSNHHVAQVMVQWASYNRERDRLIIRIMKLIERLKKRLGQRGAPAPVRESINENNQGEWLYHSGLREDNSLKFSNTKTGKVFSVGTIMEDADGIEYVLSEADASKDKATPERGVLQRADDVMRSVANTWTFGWTDNLEAKVNSWINNTSYGAELKKSVARTDAASKSALFKFTDPIFKKEWEPSAYDLGTGVASVLMLPRLGFAGTAALITADVAQEKLIRQPHNKAAIDGAEADGKPGQGAKVPGVTTGNMPFSKEVKAIQQQLMSLFGKDAVGKFKDDGKLGPDTTAAIEKAAAAGYTLKDGKIVKAEVAPSAVVNQDAGNAQADTAVANAEPEVDTSSVIADFQKSIGVNPSGTIGQADIQAFTKYVQKTGGDPYEALNKLVGGVAESRLSEGEKMGVLRNQLSQLDEAGKLDLALGIIEKIFSKGAGAEAKAGAKGAEKAAPGVKVNRASPDNPNIAGQKPYVQSRSGYGTGSQPTQFAKFENSAVGNLTKAVDDMIRGGRNPATKDIIAAAEKGFAERFGLKAGQAFRSAINGGGKVLQFMKNRKWLIAFLALAAAGYMWATADSEEPTQSGPGGNSGPGQAGMAPNAPNAPSADNEEDMSELREMLKELVEGWPDDAQTAQAVEAAKAIGVDMSASVGATSGQGGMAAAPADTAPRTGSRTGVVFPK
jgi:hypothetical protein